MKPDSRPNDLLEIYKFHAELADRVSQRREGANRLYVSLLVGLMVFFGALLRFGTDNFPPRFILCALGAVGALLSVSWYVVIRSYRQLNTGKFRVLHEIEEKLDFPFFTREWDLLSKGQDFRRYWKLTVVENTLPCIFFALFVALVVYSVLM